MTRIPFPVKYFEDNLVFGQDGAVYAYYELQRFNYDYRSMDDKLSLHSNLEAFYWNIHADTHALVVPEYQSLEEQRRAMETGLCDELKETGKKAYSGGSGTFTRKRNTPKSFFYGRQVEASHGQRAFFFE